MSDARQIEADIYERLSKVIDPELGRSVTDLGMIAAIEAAPASSDAGTYDVTVHVELTVPGCPLSETITSQINGAVSSYPGAQLLPHIEVGSMSRDKLADLVADLKAERKQNPFSKPGVKTRIFAIASGKGGVGKSSVTANLAATFAALGFDTAAIDADIYGFSLPRLFGVHTQPTNLNGMLMPVTAWGVKLISIGMFAGADRAILWRGPRLQRSLEQFLSDVWWGEPDVLLLDLAPGTGDMAISVAQALPNAELVVVTTPQPSASDIAVRSGLVALQVPMKVRGVVENMSYYEHKGEKLEIFGAGGGQRVSEQLTQALGYDVPLMAQLPLEPEVRETGEAGRPAVLDADGALRTDGIGQTFRGLAERLFKSGSLLVGESLDHSTRDLVVEAMERTVGVDRLINLQAIHMDEDAVPRCLGMNGRSTLSPISGGCLAVNNGIAHCRCDAKR